MRLATITTRAITPRGRREDRSSLGGDKCGIIKKNSKVVTCADNIGLSWIKEKCAQQGNELVLATSYQEKVGLLGEFQKKNAGIAKEVCKLLGINREIIQKGIANAYWPGRLELVEGNVLLDCAHNPAAVKAVAPFIESWPKKKLILIFGVIKNKDYKEMISLLPKADVIILTRPRFDKGMDPNELPFDEAVIKEDPKDAYEYAKSIADENDLIVVLGSSYLTGNIKEIISKVVENESIKQ